MKGLEKLLGIGFSAIPSCATLCGTHRSNDVKRVMVILLGIDPGLRITGFGVARVDRGRVTLLDCGCLRLPQSKSLPVRVALFHEFVVRKIGEHAVTDLALETPFLGKNAQNFLKLGYLRGVIYLLSGSRSLQIHEFAPCQVKRAVTGFGGASKEQVARVVAQLFPKLKDPATHDVTDAIAVTLCASWRHRPTPAARA